MKTRLAAAAALLFVASFANSQELLVPARDASRISKAPTTILSADELKAFLSKTHAAVEKKLAPRFQALALRIYEATKKKYSSSTAVANVANGFWVMGNAEVALWLMGKACIEDPNPDNLNNYAAFLVMAGGEEAALPILMKLNQRFPDNSTVLNNLGQAWFGLGDLEQADKHLNEAVRLFAYHSQANYTKCLIEESRGNKAGAIEALKKSIRQAYSHKKQNKLRRLGGESKPGDIGMPFRMPQDPLGLHRFIVPRYSRSVDESEVLEPEWEAFRDSCRKRLDELKVQEKSLASAVEELEAKRQKFIEERKKHPLEYLGRQAEILKQMADLGMLPSPLGRKAAKLYQLSLQEGHYQRERDRNDAERQRANNEIDKLRKQMSEELEPIKPYGASEGDPGPPGEDERVCRERNAVISKYLATSNTLLEQVQSAVLTTEMRRINEDTYLKQFTEHKVVFELTKNRAKQDFLHVLGSLVHCNLALYNSHWVPGTTYRCDRKAEQKQRESKLPDFDDIHCEHTIELNMFFVKGEFTCNTAKLEYDAVIISGEHLENLNTGKTIRGNAQLGVTVGLGKGLELGPLKAEAKAGVGAFVEYDEDGVADFGPTAVVKGELGAKLSEGQDPTEIKIGERAPVAIGELPSVVEVGVEGRWGWNAGGSLEGKGILKGIGIKE